MKRIEAVRLGCRQVKAADIPALFRKNGVAYHRIDTVDWPSDYPYCPDVKFAIAHKGDCLMLHYKKKTAYEPFQGPTWVQSGKTPAASSSAVRIQKEAITTSRPTASGRCCSATERAVRTVHRPLTGHLRTLTAGPPWDVNHSERETEDRHGSLRSPCPSAHSSVIR